MRSHICAKVTGLLLHQIAYDHLDPEMLARATIEDGQISIGQARYEVLILPPLTNLEGAAWAQVKAFLRAGGKVISVGLLPYECIEQGQEKEAEILQWFGLTTSPRQNYWREPAEQPLGHSEAGQEQISPWIKGQHTAYFLPARGGLQQERERNTIELRLTNTLCGMLEGTHFDASAHRIVPVNDLRQE